MKVKIYKITNKINGKIYVGKTKHSLADRFYQHKQNARNHESCMLLYNAMNKYGSENFEIELLDEVESENWEYWERKYIKDLKAKYTYGNYNISDGGDVNPTDSEIARKHFYEKVYSEEFREKQRKQATGRKHSEESRRKMSAIQKIVQNDPAIKAKIVMHQPNRFPVKMLDKDGNFIKEFCCCSDALRYINKPVKEAGAIKAICDKFNKNGKRSAMFGYCWSKGDL